MSHNLMGLHGPLQGIALSYFGVSKSSHANLKQKFEIGNSRNLIPLFLSMLEWSLQQRFFDCSAPRFNWRRSGSFSVVLNLTMYDRVHNYAPEIVCSFMHSSMVLQPFVGLWPLLQSRNLFYIDRMTPWTSISPLQGRYLHAGEENRECLERNSKPRFQLSSERGHCGRRNCMYGFIILSAINNGRILLRKRSYSI
jgi:hypothetical protein